MSQLHLPTGEPITTGDTLFDDTGKPVSTQYSGVGSLIGCLLTDSHATQTLSNGVAAAITFDTENRDPIGMHSTSVNTSRITVPTGYGGAWMVGGNIQWANNTAGVRSLRIRYNNTNYIASQEASVNGVGGGVFEQSVCLLSVNIADGDYWELFAFQNSGGDLNANTSVANTNFWAFRVATT